MVSLLTYRDQQLNIIKPPLQNKEKSINNQVHFWFLHSGDQFNLLCCVYLDRLTMLSERNNTYIRVCFSPFSVLPHILHLFLFLRSTFCMGGAAGLLTSTLLEPTPASHHPLRIWETALTQVTLLPRIQGMCILMCLCQTLRLKSFGWKIPRHLDSWIQHLALLVPDLEQYSLLMDVPHKKVWL